MGQVSSTTLGAASLLAVGALYFVHGLLGPRSQLDTIPGPGNGHFLFGNMRELWADEAVAEQWVRTYGRVVKIARLFNKPELILTDLRAINHVLQHGDVYHKSKAAQEALAHVLGRGVLVAEGERHRVQRKALNPAFGPSQLRDLTGILLDKANELRDVLLTRVPPGDGTEMNIMRPLSDCTLDIIGLAGFGYDFHALSLTQPPSELAVAFRTMFSAGMNPRVLMLQLMFPAVRYLPTDRNRRIAAAMAVMRRIGTELLHERKAEAAAEAAQGEKISDSRPRDILSLLVRANTVADPRQRLSDTEVLDQIPTFLVAGHETTATLLTWTLFQLSIHPDIQAELRAECRARPLPSTAAGGNEPLDVAELERAPLLDAVLRETLRVNSPVSESGRVAVRDDMLPLSSPITDKSGAVRDALPVVPGDAFKIPIDLVNMSEELWGADAKTWNPHRWIDQPLPDAAKAVPGVFSHLLSFLGGAHACIGYRFSLYEAKIILHALVSAFEFRLAVPEEQIGKRIGIVTRPMLKSAKEIAQLPLIVSRAPEEAL